MKTGILPLERLIALMSDNPRKRFALGGGEITDGEYTVWDLGAEYSIHPEEFLTMGRSTPFDGTRVFGRCIATVYNGQCVYSANNN